MPNRSLIGRTAVVTGVGRRVGIGYAIARRLLEAGASVVAQAWTPYDMAEWNAAGDEADAVLAGLRETGGRAQLVQVDFAEPDAAANLFRAAREEFGHVDILVVNHTRSGLDEIDPKDSMPQGRWGRPDGSPG